MKDIFDIFECEVDCDMKQIEYDFSLLNFSTFFEDGDTKDSTDGLIPRIISKIDHIITTIKTKLQEFFQSKKTKESIDEIEKASIKDNGILNTKVKMKDYKKINTLNEKTVKDLDNVTSEEDLKKQMEKYRSQRNKLIIGSIAVTVTLSGCIALLKKHQKDKIENLEKEADKQKSQLKELNAKCKKYQARVLSESEKNKKLTQENSILKEKTPAKRLDKRIGYTAANVQSNCEKFKGTMNGAQKIAAAKIEVLGNSAKDCMSEVREAMNNIQESKNVIQKAGSVVKATKNITNTGKEAINGTKSKVIMNSNADNMKKELQHMSEQIKKAKKALSDSDKDSERYKKAKSYLQKALPAFKQKQYEYSVLKK